MFVAQYEQQETIMTIPTPEPVSIRDIRRVESGPIVRGRYIPTASLDPRCIELIDGVDNENVGYVRVAIDAFGTIHSALQKLSDAREAVKKDTSKTEANQILIVAKEAERAQDRATRAFDDAHKRLTDG